VGQLCNTPSACVALDAGTFDYQEEMQPMFQRIRTHLTPSTAIAFLALVFALTGGAFAASSHGGGPGSGAKATASSTLASVAKSKAKPKGKAGPRGPAGPKGATGATGPVGPAGPAGATGPAGANGKDGANGSNGENGAAGTSATAKSFTGVKKLGSEECKAGGLEVTAASGTSLVCNGTNGTTGFTETLPVGKTETGTWATGAPSETPFKQTAISFPIPLASNVETHFVGAGETPPEQCPSEYDEAELRWSKAEATPGNLCVYEGETSELKGQEHIFNAIEPPGGEGTPDKAGIILWVATQPNGFAVGSWAVTAG
jgi:hypothetical protein